MAMPWLRACALAFCVFVGACGGGGSDGDSPAPPALTLSPPKLTSSQQAGQVATLSVRATVTDPSIFNGAVYVHIVDSAGVISPKIDLAQLDLRTFSATIRTSPALAAGRYEGRLELRLCRDSGCGSQYPGSPVNLPYDFTVTQAPPAGAATITIAPAMLASNHEAGVSATLTVRASTDEAAGFSGPVFVSIAGGQEVFSSTVNASPINQRTYSATMYTLPTLGSGRYQGNLQLQFCRDAACAVHHPGSPQALPYDLTVTPAPLRATAVEGTSATVHWGASLPLATTVSVTGAGLDWTASTVAPWLRITGGQGLSAGRFSVGYVPEGLAVGSYAADVVVRAGDGQSVSIRFSLQVIPTQFELLSGVPTFSAVNGNTIAAQSLSFALDSGVASPWTGISSQPWLIFTPASGVTPGTLSIQPDPSIGPLASGTHLADITLSSPGISSRTVATRLNLTAPSLSSSSLAITLGGSKGRDLVTAQSATLRLNTGGNAYAWSLSALPDWLTSSTRSGSVAQSGTPLLFAPNSRAVAAGSVSTTVNVTATVNGDTVTLPLTVNLNVDQHRLLPSTWGVGLSSTPLGTVLTRTLKVSDNFGGSLGWNARSDQPWLSVTSSGRTGETDLVLTSDPTLLPDGQISFAKVTIETSEAGVEKAVVRVAFWKDAGAPSTITKLPQAYVALVADRIRPWVYAHNGGTTIDVYHAYTAKRVATIPGVASALGAMTLSPDGSRLYALDTAAQSMALVDLDTLSRVDTWSLDMAVSAYHSLQAIRPNGMEVLLVGNGRAYAQGRSLGPTGVFGTITASDDGRRVFTQDTGFSPASVAAYEVDYSAMSGGMLMVATRGGVSFINGASNGKDIAVSGDGRNLLTASGAPYRCSRVAPDDLSFIGSLPGGDAYPNNVEITTDGRLICGISGWYAASDFWVHSATGALLNAYKVAGYAREIKTGTMVATPDGLLVVVLTDDPVIAFVPIGSP